eukprot:11570638-Alexandrium_andersonii.AAC.1
MRRRAGRGSEPQATPRPATPSCARVDAGELVRGWGRAVQSLVRPRIRGLAMSEPIAHACT